MSHYTGLSFFLFLLVLLIPAIVLGLAGKSQRIWGLCATVLMLLALFHGWKAKLLLLAFAGLQTAVAYGYLALRRRYAQRPLLWLALLVSLAPLLLVKLSGLIPELRFLQILGISYMSFRAIGVLIEIYDGYIKTLNLIDYLYFLLFFPAISSGPLDRYRRFCTDLHTKRSGADYGKLLREGCWRLMGGAVYNFVIGNLIWQLVIARLPEHGFLSIVGYFYAYTFFMFFNFAGYSRMAMGTAYLLGVQLPDNFNAPFAARDMKDFWARWHISLSSFLRDFVYTRFCMTAVGKKWFGGGRACSYVGYFLTMTLMGLWHGLTPGYLVYGLYHGVVMSVNDILDTKWKKFRKIKKNKRTAWICTLVTFHLFAFGLLLFSGRIL